MLPEHSYGTVAAAWLPHGLMWVAVEVLALVVHVFIIHSGSQAIQSGEKGGHRPCGQRESCAAQALCLLCQLTLVTARHSPFTARNRSSKAA